MKALESALLNIVSNNNNNNKSRQYVAAKMTINKFLICLLFILGAIVAVYLNKNVSLDYPGKILKKFEQKPLFYKN